MNLRKTTIITDPVHEVMNLGSDPGLWKCLKSVIDTTSFQRLRRISQLGLASYVFPGATHTRFSHSLGVAYLAYTVLRHLQERAAGDEAKQISNLFYEVIIAALVHDIGHGPFSHSFERVLSADGEFPGAPMHENWTEAIITDPSSEIYAALVQNNLNPARIASVFGKRPKGERLPRYLKEIVSSQLDVDRMDYLVRDSHFAGVEVGRFDVAYLINSLVVVRHGGHSKSLGLSPKGVKAYEAFLVARQLMNRTVYYHHKVKVLEYMMEQFIREVLRALSGRNRRSPVDPYLPQYFRAVGQLARKKGTFSESDFMRSHLADYLELTEDRVWALVGRLARLRPRNLRRVSSLAQMLLRREVVPHYPVLAGKDKLLDEALSDSGYCRDVDYGLVNPSTTMYRASSEDRVFVVDWNGAIEEVPAFSQTISALRDKPEVEALLVIVDPAKDREIEKHAAELQSIVPKHKPVAH